jgi:ABC-2 type transport system permease protein
VEALGAATLLTIVLLAWIIPHGRAALTFSEAEVNFLFPAPVSRRTLIHFKLLKSQTGILFTTLLLTLISGRFGTGGAGWIRALGWWIILSTLNLHFLGSSFARSSLLEHGISNWKRRLIVLLLVTGFLAGIVIWSFQTIPNLNLADLRDIHIAKEYFREVTNAGPAPYLLYPFRLLVRPFLAKDGVEFFVLVSPALVVMLLHYLWVVRANVAFEEASVELSQRIAERVTAVRAGNYQPRPTKAKRAPFALGPSGPPSIALLWKNLIAAGQAFTLRVWIILVICLIPFFLSFSSALGRSDWRSILGLGALFVIFWSLMIGPQVLRHDFRRDLAMADILKSFPLRGWQIVVGELLAPTAILTAIQWLLLLAAAGLVTRIPQGPIVSLEWRVAIALGAAVVFPMLNLISLIIPNASVLLFPGWFLAGPDRPHGIEATGQALIFLLGQVLVFMLAVLPAVIAFVAVFLPLSYLGQQLIAIPLASVASTIALGVEVAIAIFVLGRIFERFDLSAET